MASRRLTPPAGFLRPSPLGAGCLALAQPMRAQPSTDDAEWTMAAKEDQSRRYSGRDEINVRNASQLQVAWAFSTRLLRGHEAAPLVVGSTMYLVKPYSNVLYALDLQQDEGMALVLPPAG